MYVVLIQPSVVVLMDLIQEDMITINVVTNLITDVAHKIMKLSKLLLLICVVKSVNMVVVVIIKLQWKVKMILVVELANLDVVHKIMLLKNHSLWINVVNSVNLVVVLI